jgi:hypothetical protein
MAPMQIRRFSFAPLRLCCRVMVVGFELIGARFKMSALGAARSPILADKEGVIKAVWSGIRPGLSQADTEAARRSSPLLISGSRSGRGEFP